MNVDETPLPIAQTTAEEQAQAQRQLGDAVTDLNNPLSTAVAFVNAVRALGSADDAKARQVLETVTLRLDDWDDFVATRDLVGDLGLGSVVQYSDDRPDQLAYVKLMDVSDQTVRAFATALVPDAIMITMVRPSPDGLWLVFAISEGGGLPASRVFSE